MISNIIENANSWQMWLRLFIFILLSPLVFFLLLLEFGQIKLFLRYFQRFQKYQIKKPLNRGFLLLAIAVYLSIFYSVFRIRSARKRLLNFL